MTVKPSAAIASTVHDGVKCTTTAAQLAATPGLRKNFLPLYFGIWAIVLGHLVWAIARPHMHFIF